MSDIGGAGGGEPSAAGNQYTQFNIYGGGRRGRGRQYNVGGGAQAGFNMQFPGVDAATQSIGSLSTAIDGLKRTLKSLSNDYTLMNGIKKMMDDIVAGATKATGSMKDLGGAVKNVSKGGGGGGTGAPAAAFSPTVTYGATPTTAPLQGGGTAAGWVANANTNAGAAITAAGGGSGAEAMGGSALGALTGGGNLLDMFGDLAMFPLRFMRDRIQTNRQSTLFMSQSLTPFSFATGQGQGAQMGNLVNFPVMGTPADVMNVLAAGRQAGAFYDFGQAGKGGPRQAGFIQGLQQMQMLTPGVSATQMANTLGGYAANTQSQQMGAFYTSGAFSIVKQGGGMKSIQEWAEGILRWLEGQRPGSDRGKPFDYGQLMAQYFPGSNIDAWFQMNAVPQDMRDYFWTYALGKANKSATGTQGEFKLEAPTGNLAYTRLQSQNQFTRNEFGLASRMQGQYTNRETVNKWFNGLMGAVVNRVIPSLTAPGSPLSIVQWLPDVIEELMFGMLEKTGPLGQMILGGGLTAGAVIPGLLSNIPLIGGALSGVAGAVGGVVGGVGNLAGKIGSALNPFGDVPEGIGDYGVNGGTTTAGLHPDMRRKVTAMMADNPRLTMVSGLRDHSTQQRLRARGIGRVSGKPSAHTRGMAADLGPSSEYQWLISNASRYGLKSGVRAGEPWHVGMGDIGDIPGLGVIKDLAGVAGGLVSGGLGMLGNVFGAAFGGGTDLIGGLLKSGMGALLGPIAGLTGPAGALLMAIMAGSKDPVAFLNENIGNILNLLLGGFGKEATGAAIAPTAFDPAVAAKLSTKISLGGSVAGGFGGMFGLLGNLQGAGLLASLGGTPGLAPTTGTPSTGGTQPAGTGGTTPVTPVAPGSAGASGKIDPHLIYTYLRQNSVSQASAAGILANAYFESGFDSTIIGDHGSSGGLFQHHAGRWTALKNYAASTGRPWTDYKAQVEYALQEARTPSYGINLQATDPKAAATQWALQFEKMSGGATSAAQRAARAPQYMYGDVAEPTPWGLPPEMYAMEAMPRGGGNTTTMVFHNTFTVNGGGNGQGPNQGIDLKRTAAALADHLENEMRTRAARTN